MDNQTKAEIIKSLFIDIIIQTLSFQNKGIDPDIIAKKLQDKSLEHTRLILEFMEDKDIS